MRVPVVELQLDVGHLHEAIDPAVVDFGGSLEIREDTHELRRVTFTSAQLTFASRRVDHNAVLGDHLMSVMYSGMAEPPAWWYTLQYSSSNESTAHILASPDGTHIVRPSLNCTMYSLTP